MEHFFAPEFTTKKKTVKNNDFVASCRHKARKHFQGKVSTSLTAARGQTHGHHNTVMISYEVCRITRTIGL
jgi:hypothetical protein